MTRYEFFKFLHVVGAIGWVGSGIGLLVLSRRLITAREHTALLGISRQSKALGNLIFAPAFVLTLGAGIALVATTSGIGFGDLWILIGFGGIVASGVVEMAIAQPAGNRYLAAVEEEGPDSPRALAAVSRATLGSALDVALLLAVVWVMVAKPTI